MKVTYIITTIVIALASSSSGLAYGIAISGDVLDSSSSGINDAKITVEKPDEYQWGRSSSDGSYSITVDTLQSYDVDAMKSQFDHNRESDVSGGTSNVDITISSRNDETLDILITADEEFRNHHGSDWKDDAKDKVGSPNGSEAWFGEEHSIKYSFVPVSDEWNSESSLYYCKNEMLADAKDDTGWSTGDYDGADILVALTRQDTSDVGCVDSIPSQGGTHPATLIDDTASIFHDVVLHEISHLYGMEHQSTDYWGIMNSDLDKRIKNWMPSYDDDLGNRRTWY